jgi:outer membrane usher protein
VQLDSTSTEVAPRAGAVVMVKFKSESGRFVLIQAHLPNGATLPFGAEVTDEQGQPVGVVGQAGRIMVRTARETGRLNVQWQDQDVLRACSFPYRLQPRSESRHGIGAIEQIDATCEQPHDTAQIAGSGT